MANTRLCLGVEVQGGEEHAARHGLPGLARPPTSLPYSLPPPRWSLLDALPRTHWPAFVRGDCGYGNEVLLGECEARGLPCFFKLRHTAKVKTLLAQMQRAGAVWTDAGEGWEVLEARLRLSGWSRGRRVVLVRETPALAPVGEPARRRRDTFAPALPGAEGWSRSPAARPPTSLPIPLLLLGPGPDGSPCSSPPLMKPPTPPWPSRGFTANAPTPKTSTTNSRTNGAGAAIRHKSSPPAGSWPT